jgi:hypothetical protein
VATAIREWLVVERALEHVDGLREALHPHADRVERQPDGVEFGLVPTCADRDLESAVAQHVERGEVLREHCRMPEFVVEHERAQPQALSRGRDDVHRRDRRELFEQMIREHQDAVADRFGSPRPFGELAGVGDVDRFGEEAERAVRAGHRPQDARSRRRPPNFSLPVSPCCDVPSDGHGQPDRRTLAALDLDRLVSGPC